jgi:hypothetical protein
MVGRGPAVVFVKGARLVEKEVDPGMLGTPGSRFEGLGRAAQTVGSEKHLLMLGLASASIANIGCGN